MNVADKTYPITAQAARIRLPIPQRVEKAKRQNPSLETKGFSGNRIPDGVRRTLMNCFMREKDLFQWSVLIMHCAVEISAGR